MASMHAIFSALAMGLRAALGFAACSESLRRPRGWAPIRQQDYRLLPRQPRRSTAWRPSSIGAAPSASAAPSVIAASSAKTPPASKACSTSKDCAPREMCAGDSGCDAVWTCVAERPCRRDLLKYCGCDGSTFQGSSNCPQKKYASIGACGP